MNPRYPVYIISKGRWESRLTVKALESRQIPYHIVIEPQEYDQYSKAMDASKILVLPFSNLCQRGNLVKMPHPFRENESFYSLVDAGKS